MWDKALAKEFKARNNPKMIGVCIGVIHSVVPFSASIYNGQIGLNSKNTYVCEGLIERTATIVAQGTQTQSGTITISEARGYQAQGNITLEGNVTLKEILKKGDKVLVMPTADNQTFFIVDKVQGVDDVS